MVEPIKNNDNYGRGYHFHTNNDLFSWLYCNLTTGSVFFTSKYPEPPVIAMVTYHHWIIRYTYTVLNTWLSWWLKITTLSGMIRWWVIIIRVMDWFTPGWNGSYSNNNTKHCNSVHHNYSNISHWPTLQS